jgi:hypothetical protein
MQISSITVLFTFFTVIYAELYMRSLMIFEAEEVPIQMNLLDRQQFLNLTSFSAPIATLEITPGSRNLTIICQEALVAIVRDDNPSQICQPGGEQTLRNVMITGIKDGDVLIASLVEDPAIPSRLLYDLLKLSDDLKQSKGVTTRKRRLFDATAAGQLLRSIVLRIEEDISDSSDPYLLSK